MIDVVIILLLIVSFIAGRRKGFVKQVIQLIGFFVALFIGFWFSESLGVVFSERLPFPEGEGLAQSLVLGIFPLKDWFYRIIAFFLLFFITLFFFRMISGFFHTLVKWPILSNMNRFFGGVVGFVQTYVFLFLFLFIAAMLPNESAQIMMEKSILTSFILEHTPILSSLTKEWFIELERSF